MRDALALSTNLNNPQSNWPAQAGLFYGEKLSTQIKKSLVRK